METRDVIVVTCSRPPRAGSEHGFELGSPSLSQIHEGSIKLILQILVNDIGTEVSAPM